MPTIHAIATDTMDQVVLVMQALAGLLMRGLEVLLMMGRVGPVTLVQGEICILAQVGRLMQGLGGQHIQVLADLLMMDRAVRHILAQVALVTQARAAPVMLDQVVGITVRVFVAKLYKMLALIAHIFAAFGGDFLVIGETT